MTVLSKLSEINMWYGIVNKGLVFGGRGLGGMTHGYKLHTYICKLGAIERQE